MRRRRRRRCSLCAAAPHACEICVCVCVPAHCLAALLSQVSVLAWIWVRARVTPMIRRRSNDDGYVCLRHRYNVF
jgi:hypothetical protein